MENCLEEVFQVSFNHSWSQFGGRRVFPASSVSIEPSGFDTAFRRANHVEWIRSNEPDTTFVCVGARCQVLVDFRGRFELFNTLDRD